MLEKKQCSLGLRFTVSEFCNQFIGIGLDLGASTIMRNLMQDLLELHGGHRTFSLRWDGGSSYWLGLFVQQLNPADISLSRSPCFGHLSQNYLSSSPGPSLYRVVVGDSHSSTTCSFNALPLRFAKMASVIIQS